MTHYEYSQCFSEIGDKGVRIDEHNYNESGNIRSNYYLKDPIPWACEIDRILKRATIPPIRHHVNPAWTLIRRQH
jgi:hypothetical protein